MNIRYALIDPHAIVQTTWGAQTTTIIIVGDLQSTIRYAAELNRERHTRMSVVELVPIDGEQED